MNPIIELHPWLAYPSGQALLEWEQAEIDRLVADIFGFHALQLGMPELDGLQCNRMPHRWLAVDDRYAHWRLPSESAPWISAPQISPNALSNGTALGLRCSFTELPFPAQSLDLVVMPHTLELTQAPHATLREVERVLVPEGRVLITGFNPSSLWGLKQKMTRLGMSSNFVLPQGDFLAYWRLRDWLRLLNFDIDAGGFGCYRPMVESARAWHRMRWMERAGERWWPVLGAVYVLVAVKRAHGIRLIGQIKRSSVVPASAPAMVARSPRQAGLHTKEVEE